MSSARYILFAKNQVCVRCGVVGTHFAKERSIYLDRRTGRYWPTSNHFHFNLYGINRHGHEVMMTKDHILPRAHGGKDEQANYQTMCAPCNGRKRDRLPNETEAEYADAPRRLQEGRSAERNALLVRGHYIPHVKEAAE
jgi:5-methylcytosine-specific restriction endonuclease McrA